MRQREHTIFGEILAIIGLPLTAPASYYVTLGMWNGTALWLWAFSVFYFTSSVLYVKLRVLTAHAREEEVRQQMRRRCASYHSFLIGSLLVLALTGSLNLFIPIVFATIVVRAFWYMLKPADQLNLRRLGVLEIVYSLGLSALRHASFSPCLNSCTAISRTSVKKCSANSFRARRQGCGSSPR